MYSEIGYFYLSTEIGHARGKPAQRYVEKREAIVIYLRENKSHSRIIEKINVIDRVVPLPTPVK